MNKMFADREHLGSQSHHGTMGDLHSAQPTSPSETVFPGRVMTTIWCHIRGIPAHVFKPGVILRFHARKRILRAGKCTLTAPIGRQNSRGLGG
jgi:hypothetical protein